MLELASFVITLWVVAYLVVQFIAIRLEEQAKERKR